MDLSKKEKNEFRVRKRLNDAETWRWKLTFIGQKMAHNFYLYYLVDVVFDYFQGIRGIVELGTGAGALTTVLGLWGVKKRIPVLSIDKTNYHENWRVFQALNIQWVKAYHFDDGTIALVENFMEFNSPTLLVCDGGDKVKEFNFFTPRLKDGSVVMVHDWNHEIEMADISETVDQYCEPFLRRQWEKLFVQTAMFRRVTK